MTECSSRIVFMHANLSIKSRTSPREFATPCLQSPMNSVVWTVLLIKTLYNYHLTTNSFTVARRHSPVVI